MHCIFKCLTLLVPILPDYIAKLNNESIILTLPMLPDKKEEGLFLSTGILTKHPRIRGNSALESTAVRKESYTDNLEAENSSIGLLLAVKAFVQLIFNPVVGHYTTRIGYQVPIVVGTSVLLVSSLGTFTVLSNVYPF